MDSWDKLKEEVNSSAAKIVGVRSTVRHEWISNDTVQLVEKRRSASLAGNQAEYRQLSKECRKAVRHDKQKIKAEDKAQKGEADLQRGPIQDAFAHFRQLRSACPVPTRRYRILMGLL